MQELKIRKKDILDIIFEQRCLLDARIFLTLKFQFSYCTMIKGREKYSVSLLYIIQWFIYFCCNSHLFAL